MERLPEGLSKSGYTINKTMKQTVRVWNDDIEITIDQISKTVWRAVGEYSGESIEVKDRSATAVAKRWQETAEYRGNIGSHPGANQKE